MDEYIKRSDALKVIETANSMASSFLEATMKLCVTMDRISAADVVPVRHGRWIDMGDFISCSECNATRMKEFLCDYGVARRLDVRTNYCPNCGADMRQQGETE